MIYATEKYEDILPELKEIYIPFFKEVDIYPEKPEPNVDHWQFIALDEANSLQLVTAREDGKLVGFHISSIQKDIFYQHITTGYVLCYYLLPEYRGNGNGTKMFVYADESFKKRGVERIFMSRKIYIDNEKLFENLGYRQLEAGYTKCLIN